jgi:hypothetical protein
MTRINNFQTWDKRKCRTVIPERKKAHAVSQDVPGHF